MTDNFDIKKFLTENKLTKTSILREGLEENKTEEKKYNDYKTWLQAVEAAYPENLNKVKDEENFKSYWTKGEGGRFVASWNGNTNTGTLYLNRKTSEPSKYIGKENLPYYGDPNEKLRAKIKEMIIAELSLEEENEYSELDFVDEGEDFEDIGVETGEVGENDYEEYKRLEQYLNSLEDTKNPNAYTDDAFNYNSEMDPDDYYETETRVRYYSVSDDGRIVSDNKHTYAGYKPFYRTIIATPVSENEFRGL
jgi:hypothetical protein